VKYGFIIRLKKLLLLKSISQFTKKQIMKRKIKRKRKSKSKRKKAYVGLDLDLDAP